MKCRGEKKGKRSKNTSNHLSMEMTVICFRKALIVVTAFVSDLRALCEIEDIAAATIRVRRIKRRGRLNVGRLRL